MAIQVLTCNASKVKLLAALQTQPQAVSFYDPSIMNERRFSGADVKHGESFTVVMDPQTRRRFAKVMRRPNGEFRVV